MEIKHIAFRIGLTGGIGSGKSTVSQIFQELGVPVIDLDQISRTLTQPDALALPQIRLAFGNSVFNTSSQLKRHVLRELVFSSPAHKQQLEDILHPLIREEAEKQFQHYVPHFEFVVFDIPLLAPGNFWLPRLWRVLVIDCEENTQIARVSRRPGWTIEQAKAAIASQISSIERVSISTDVITNDGISLPALRQQVQNVLRLWQQQINLQKDN